MGRFDDGNRCALCGNAKDERRKLIVGLHGAVCSECIDLCNDILQKGPEGTAPPAPASRTILDQLIAMTLELARSEHGQVILGEGNTSARDGDTLWIKATGHQMPSITAGGFVQVNLGRVIQTIDGPRLPDDELRAILNDARTDDRSKNFPSTETYMHALLLTLPDVYFVAHTHPMATLGLMCGPQARQFAEQRLFPDQIVLCGPSSVYVPYVAPGLELAVAIREACREYTNDTGMQPKTILLENHGLIALGRTPKEAVSACLMTEKAAKVFSIASDPHALTPEEVEHIHNWTDEHFRQGKIWSD
jgi:rhamnose utilization protein RhaD (predicted bifunctional aldolase and dehydrogenase)